MSEEPAPRRTIIGMFPTGGTEIIAFEAVEAALIADAGRRLDQEREERERAAAQTIVVNREFFDQVVQELDRALAVEWRWWTRRRADDRARDVAGKIRYLHEMIAATLNAKVTP